MWIVSFTDREDWARGWVRETCSAFPFLLDSKRQLYKALGLERSLTRAWSPRTLLHYARAALSGRPLKPILGDSAQLGGDFVFDSGGTLHYAHRSRDPVDRPPIEELLQALRTAGGTSASAGSEVE